MPELSVQITGENLERARQMLSDAGISSLLGPGRDTVPGHTVIAHVTAPNTETAAALVLAALPAGYEID